MTIYCYDYCNPNVEDDELITAYFAATTQNEADEQFAQYSRGVDGLHLIKTAHIANEEIDVGLFGKIANFAFAVDDDFLLMALFKLHPNQAPRMIGELLFSHNMPQSFKHAVSVLKQDESTPNWLATAVGNGKVDYAQILLDCGFTDCDGTALARACVFGYQQLFDMVYPVSNPLQALQKDTLRNRDWIEQRMAEEQNKLLHAEVSNNTPSPLKIKKI